MLSKWSQKEDQDLAKIIRRYGTTNWALIRRHFKSNRTRDSVIKRWHGKLKFERNNLTVAKEENKTINNNKAPPAIRKNREEAPPTKNRYGMRSGLQIEREKGAKILSQRPKDSKRFQRIRSFLQNTSNTRNRPTNAKATKKEEPQIQEESQEVQQSEDSNFEYQHEWNKVEDEKLRNLVLNDGISSWKKMAEVMSCSEKEVRKRWKQQIYKTIKLEDKVGGFLKYSSDEDAILTIAHRNGLKWEQIMVFLPGRSEFSIEARWRRLARTQFQVQLTKNKHFMMREFLKKITQKRKSERQPLQLNNQLQLLKH